MELRRQAEDEPEQLAPLRRGWCLGSAGFREVKGPAVQTCK